MKKIAKKSAILIIIATMLLSMGACGKEEQPTGGPAPISVTEELSAADESLDGADVQDAADGQAQDAEEPESTEIAGDIPPADKEDPEEEQKPEGQIPQTPPLDTSSRPTHSGDGLLVAIDAGHQGKGNSEKEPLGPGSSEMKAKVSSGATGKFTGQLEYQLNLKVALKLQAELEARGYDVLMIRTSHDVNISNAERAEVANNAGADAFIRIHANGSDDSSVKGAETICQTPNNPYNSHLYSQSRALSDAVLSGIGNATGCKVRYVWETDSMTGINWCQVPVTIVEMGYLSNQEEDTLLATDDYQNRMAYGMADGLDTYFGR